MPRRPRPLAIAALCAVAMGALTAAPAQADRVGATWAAAARAWTQMQADGQRLEGVVNRYDGARLKLAQTETGIRRNEQLLRVTRVNLANARKALDASLISAYESPAPDPLEAALEARNFGQVLEQFTLLDRTDTYNAATLRSIRAFRLQIVQQQAALARERTQRTATVSELGSLRRRITASVAAEKRRYDDLRLQVRHLIAARQAAEVAASHRIATRTLALAANAAGDVVAANDIGGVSSGSSAPLPAPSSVGTSAVSVALSQLGTPYVPGGAAPGGFDCSGLVSWAYAQAGHPGLPHYTVALWSSGTHIDSQSQLAPGDLVFFDGLGHVGMYIGGGNFVEAPHSGDVVKITSLASRSDYDGAVRISG